MDKASDIFDLVELEADEVIIQSIKRSRMRTMVMIAQIENCLDILKDRMVGKGQPEKYEVINSLYLDRARRDIERGELIKTVAIELNCNERSIYRWKNEMVTELSILLFGIDGLRLDL
jgi:translation elongation factor EF-4